MFEADKPIYDKILQEFNFEPFIKLTSMLKLASSLIK